MYELHLSLIFRIMYTILKSICIFILYVHVLIQKPLALGDFLMIQCFKSNRNEFKLQQFDGSEIYKTSTCESKSCGWYLAKKE